MATWTLRLRATKDGITAIQMDIKIHGLTRPIVEEAIAKTKDARMYILNEIMIPCIQPAKTDGRGVMHRRLSRQRLTREDWRCGWPERQDHQHEY